MDKRNAVLDYNCGNIFSLRSAISKLGRLPVVTSDKEELSSCQALILPGVGTFSEAMDNLEELDLVEFLRNLILKERKLCLGICLGMQIMFDSGEEVQPRSGLGIIDGAVKKLASSSDIRIPHVGFNSTYINNGESVAMAGIDLKSRDFYFVHSYAAKPENRPGTEILCRHGDEFLASYEHENIFAAQFHPEKSQSNGFKYLSNFLDLV